MADAQRVTARQQAILSAIIESYIEFGEPVGSGTVAESFARSQAEAAPISSATIRNEMAALADVGLLEQPHTSAGRVPTARAFRLYVEELMRGEHPRINATRLPAHSRMAIDSNFAGLAGTQELLQRTSHVLATLSSGVGLAVTAALDGDLLEHVHFSRLAARRVLAVVVMRSGLVRDRVLALEQDPSLRELETAARYLNENFRGWSVERVRAEIARRLEQERSEYQQLLATVQQLWSRSLPGSGVETQGVYVEGVANLVDSQAVARHEDRERLRELLSALEAKQRLVELLNAYIDARQESVRVVFDLAEQAPEMAGLVLIAAPARVGAESFGTLGVIGPKRMHYENTMNAVSYIANVFDRMMHRTD
ncbi:MAG: heat-inducible transcription repressor HrcA [Acidobacteriota bacterium]|nr:heat-inducible transcription repressor HrcA [Acidobacteriota bacterium]